jgi:hypothetical protein
LTYFTKNVTYGLLFKWKNNFLTNNAFPHENLSQLYFVLCFKFCTYWKCISQSPVGFHNHYINLHQRTFCVCIFRKVALTVILTRAGLGLDIIKLKKLSWAVLRLAFIPCAAEIMTSAVVSRFLLGFPWAWSLMLG